MMKTNAYRYELEHLDNLFSLYVEMPSEVKKLKDYTPLKLRVLNYFANSIMGFAIACILLSLGLMLWKG